MDITRELKRICIVKECTMTDIANELNISFNYLMRLKQGSRGNVNQLEKIYKLIQNNKDEKPKNFASWLKLEMFEKDISVEKICKETGVSRYALYNGISKTRGISKKTKKRIIDALNKIIGKSIKNVYD